MDHPKRCSKNDKFSVFRNFSQLYENLTGGTEKAWSHDTLIIQPRLGWKIHILKDWLQYPLPGQFLGVLLVDDIHISKHQKPSCIINVLGANTDFLAWHFMQHKLAKYQCHIQSLRRSLDQTKPQSLTTQAPWKLQRIVFTTITTIFRGDFVCWTSGGDRHGQFWSEMPSLSGISSSTWRTNPPNHLRFHGFPCRISPAKTKPRIFQVVSQAWPPGFKK